MISVALLRPLSELLARIDEDAAAFLEELEVPPEAAPNLYVDAARVDRALDRIASRRGDPALAMTLARISAIRPLGLFGHMVWLSGTVRDALERAVKRYQMVTRRTQLELIESGDIAVVRSTPVEPDAPRGKILAEFPFASLALRARETTGGAFHLRAMRFGHAGEATPAYAEVFRAPVTFGNGVDELECAIDQLSLPLASADPITVQAIEATVAQLSATPQTSLVDRVRRAIGDANDPELAVVAGSLGMSERTLRRHLEQDQTSLRQIADELRRARADAMLAAGRSVKDVAFALGFSEPSAFSRAYKRWTGKAPTEG
ncbi:MAG TPA: AraC family transcriptional regulator ligand-binding domain-containing protein [Kofleriaceae bacterium]